jgi:hypothetical protein
MFPVGHQAINTSAFFNTIGNEKKPNVDMLCALDAQSLSILLQKNRTLVVLEQNVVLYSVALSLHEIPSPTNGRHEVVSVHDLGLCRTPSIELLLCGNDDWKPTS